jgi:ribose transport system ATP-binding protein
VWLPFYYWELTDSQIGLFLQQIILILNDGGANMGQHKLVLEMRSIDKEFPGVKALHNVSLTVSRGEVLGLVGENGAGKSTLIKILSGAYKRDGGEIFINGKLIEGRSPHEMIQHGIAVIYQEAMLAPHLSTADNIFMGRLPLNALGMVEWRKLERDTLAISERLGFNLQPRTRVQYLSVAQRQMVEIAKAMSRNAHLIVLDEPSAVLGDAELKGLFNVIRSLAKQGVSFIYISHRLNEVFEIADRVTVMKDGQVVGTDQVKNFTTGRLIQMMVGRELSEIYPDRQPNFGTEALAVHNLTRRGVLSNISFSIREGEILGIAGLAGSGRTETLRAILGADRIDSGKLEVFGKSVHLRSPRHAIQLGIGLLPEDRKTEGLLLLQSVGFNVTISRLNEFAPNGILRPGIERNKIQDYIERLNIRTRGARTPIRSLSGGNQQKCVFAKWLNADCRILLVDEPTRGVDVGAKREIYQLMADLASRGVAIIMVSSELPEILGMSDRVLVMQGGQITAELSRTEATEERIMSYATHHQKEDSGANPSVSTGY